VIEKEFIEIDISDPSDMKVLSTLNEFKPSYEMLLRGDYVYVLDSGIARKTSEYLYVIDISVPGYPVVTGSVENMPFDPEHWIMHDTSLDLHISGDYLYDNIIEFHSSSYLQYRMEVIDISNPFVPVKAGVIEDPDGRYVDFNMLFSGKYFFNPSSDLEIFEIVSPLEFEKVGYAGVPNTAFQCDIEGNFVGVITTYSDIITFSVVQLW